ncbi:hypothetical protein K491DRAFT_410308 [Lophiostoma macrostomum CBS 122681]|uniref:Uncharacterized protein n=1 Tax=Lophiostoma macrostomum CBS 122681 TaxID=1314788 RepID=A0A6A6T952_9PLEO|nr:hypothetical protein K491DRAFT_410308 [Lophiostoma macrostomum CBS 122681]
MQSSQPSAMTSSTPTRSKNPCYRQAFYRKETGEITEAEYFHAIFQHLVKDGVHHKGDDLARTELEDVDPLGYSLSHWIANEKIKIKDAKPYENVFEAYRRGNVKEIQATLSRLDQGHQWHTRTCLALLALQERNAPILNSLLEDGIHIEEPFEDEVRRVQRKHDPQTYKLLREYSERKKRPWAERKRPRMGHPLDWGK